MFWKLLTGLLLTPLLLLIAVLVLLQTKPAAVLHPLLFAGGLQAEHSALELDLIGGQFSTRDLRVSSRDSTRPLLEAGAFDLQIVWREIMRLDNSNAVLTASAIELYLASEPAQTTSDEPGMLPADLFGYRGLVPGTIDINQVTIHWGSPEQEQITTLDSLSAQMLAGGEGLTLTLAGQQMDIPLEVSAGIDGLQALTNNARQFRLALIARAPDQQAELTLDGTITVADAAIDYTADAAFSLADIATLLELLAIDFDLRGTASLQTHVHGDLHQLWLTGAKLELAQSGQYQATASGDLSYEFSALPVLDLALQATLANMALLEQLSGAPLAALGSASAAVKVSGPLDDLLLRDIALATDDGAGLETAAQGQLHLNRLLNDDFAADSHLSLQIATPGLQPLQQWLGTVPLDPGNWTLRANLLTNNGLLMLQDLHLHSGAPGRQELTLTGAVGDLSGALDGDFQAISNIDLAVALSADQSKSLTDLFDAGEQEIPELGPVTASANISGTLEQLMISALELDSGRAGSTTLSVSGGSISMTPLPQFALRQLQLPLAASLSSTSELSGIIDDVVADLGSVEAAAVLQQDANGLRLNDLTLRLHRGKRTLLTATGSVARLDTLQGINIEGTLSGLETDRLVESVLDKNFPQLQAGSLHGQFSLAYDAGSLSVRGLDIHNRGAPGLEFRIQGKAQFDELVSSVDMHLDTAITEAVLLRELTGGRVQRLQTAIDVVTSNNDIKLQGALTIGDSVLKPDLHLAIDGTTLKCVSGSLYSPALYLRDFGLDQALGKAADREEVDSAAPASAGFDPQQPLPLQQLPDTEIDIAIRVDTINGNTPLAKDFSAHITAANQRWAIESSQVKLTNGFIEVAAALDNADKEPSWSLKGLVADLQLHQLITELGGGSDVRGDAHALVDIRVTGAIPAQMPATLAGTGGFALEDLRIKGAAYDQLATDAVAWFLTGGVLNDETHFSCVLGEFDFGAGIATSRVLFAESEHLVAGGRARLDLNTKMADISITPRSKRRKFQIPGTLEIEGPLNDLGISTSPISTGVDTYVQAITIAPNVAINIFDKTARLLTNNETKAKPQEPDRCQQAIAAAR